MIVSSDGVLLCPNCGGDYLHHNIVEAFERREDEAAGMHITVLGVSDEKTAQLVVDSDMGANPSGRRQGVAIGFWCEHCNARSVLTIAQHKGSTLVEHKVRG